MEVRIDGWQKGIRFSSAHLTADLGKCERLHGHTYAIHASIHGEPGPDRIVFDFTQITKALRGIADELDHFILVPGTGDRYRVDTEGDMLTMTFDQKRYVFPKDDCYVVPMPSTTAEDLVRFVRHRFDEKVTLPETVRRVRLGVDEGYGQGAWLDYDPKED